MALVVVFVLGIAVRWNGLDAEPLSFHPTRQYRSALIARAMYLDRTAPAGREDRVVADRAARSEGVLEPPIFEAVTSVAYQAAGGEHLWLPRLVSALVWLAGAVALGRLLTRFVGALGCVTGIAAFLLLPIAVEGGRSFQPDCLMVTLMVSTFLAVVRYGEHRTRGRLVIAAATAAAAITIKVVAAPMVVAFFVAHEALTRRSGARRWRSMVAFSAVALSPAVLVYGTGLLVNDQLRDQAHSNFIPRLLTDASFWRDWASMVNDTVGAVPFLLAAVGVFLVRSPWRAVTVALFAGYVVFGVTNDYRTATHSYYHLQLVPVVAIGLAALADAVPRLLRSHRVLPVTRVVVLLGAMLLSGLVVRNAFTVTQLDTRRSSQAIADDKQIGALTGHSARVLALTDDYGASLAYYGSVVATEYPSHADDVLARLQGHTPVPVAAHFGGADSPEWFVVTNVDEWRANSELRDYVVGHFRLAVDRGSWLAYDLRGQGQA